MKRFVLARSKRLSNENATVGVLFDDTLDELCKILELPWKDNKKGVSCIPAGKYRVIRHNAPSKGPSFWIQNVPKRSEILIHVANHTSELRGCLAPGERFQDFNNDGIVDVKNSGKAMKKLLEVLPDEFELIVEWA